MTFYSKEEQEIWQCTKHPSKRHRINSNGVCPLCLKERLSVLCPNCANLRPCSCSSKSIKTGLRHTHRDEKESASSPSSSESSSFSLYFPDGAFGPVSTIVDTEPQYHRRAAFPFFRSARFSTAGPVPVPEKSTGSFWSVFRRRNSVREKLTRSRSVAVGGGKEIVSSTSEKAKRWYFPSPMKVFRHVKASKVAHERSPLHLG